VVTFAVGCVCGDKECTLSHDKVKLNASQVLQVKDMLVAALKKITDKMEQV